MKGLSNIPWRLNIWRICKGQSSLPASRQSPNSSSMIWKVVIIDGKFLPHIWGRGIHHCFGNFKQALLRVPGYVGCMETCGPLWLRLRFRFPLIWLPVILYISNYILTKREERHCWKEWIACNGFLHSREAPQHSFNLTNLHGQIMDRDSDSE